MVDAARSGHRYSDIHVFIGGTGAVGGTALLQMLAMYEEMMAIQTPKQNEVPILLATGKGAEDIRAFTRRLFRFVESRRGVSSLPRPIGSGYITRSGVFIAFERFQLTVLPGLEKIREVDAHKRVQFMSDFLAALGGDPADVFGSLMQAITQSRPIGSFLREYQAKHYNHAEPKRFRSVVLGIPIPSLLAYHLDHLEFAAQYMEKLTRPQLDQLREAFRESFRNDLAEVAEKLADTVLVAHTTAVGGMYDEELRDGQPVRRIRLGFAHSAQDDRLVIKQREAEEFTREYSRIGLKILITAAAIGIDEVRIRAEVPLHFQIARKLKDAPQMLLSGGKKTARTKSAPANDKSAVPPRQLLKVYTPVTFPLQDPSSGPVMFTEKATLRPSYSIRSGENGFFTVANADALYRVMRVASASELGEVLATVGLLGDDPLSPWFRDGVCYYTETDNSRQVFDLLNQPQLLQAQLSGLEPMALQDLGSSKHQGELHTLAMLILLHRIRTLDVDAIDPYVDLDLFDARRFLVEHSRPLTFENLDDWQFDTLAREMQVLAGAETAQELTLLNPGRPGLFPLKDEALRRVYEQVLHAIWMVPSLGSPILFERDGRTLVRAGYFIAPLDLLFDDQGAMAAWFRKNHQESRNPCTLEEYCSYHICNGGFVDLRPLAVLSTARNTKEDLQGKVRTFRDEPGLRAAMREIEPYSSFTTCGLVALLYRLRSLYNLLREAMVELGTLQEFRWQMPRDPNGHILLVPGVVEAFRMVSEGLEKTTGTERLDGIWQYERRVPPERWNDIQGARVGDGQKRR